MSGAISRTITGEGSLLLLSFLFGIFLMLLYDVLRIFRHLWKHPILLLAVEDMIYWTLCAVGIFAMLYRENDGLLRWFVLAGVALGMLLENSYISPWVVRFLVRIFRAVFRILGKLFGFLEKPGKAAARKGKKVLLFFRKRLKKIQKAIKIGLCKL